ncbi:MAG: VRR-NUC domain-containing protein [Synergistaceae bacterium]
MAIPNGGARNIVTAGKLKAEGVSRGVPDLFIPEWGFWIEMKKRKGGLVSADQKDWINYLNTKGYKAVVCKGCMEALEAVKQRQKEMILRCQSSQQIGTEN